MKEGKEGANYHARTARTTTWVQRVAPEKEAGNHRPHRKRLPNRQSWGVQVSGPDAGRSNTSTGQSPGKTVANMWHKGGPIQSSPPRTQRRHLEASGGTWSGPPYPHAIWAAVESALAPSSIHIDNNKPLGTQGQIHLEASGGIWEHLEAPGVASGGFWDASGGGSEASGGIWKHLEAPGVPPQPHAIWAAGESALAPSSIHIDNNKLLRMAPIIYIYIYIYNYMYINPLTPIS